MLVQQCSPSAVYIVNEPKGTCWGAGLFLGGREVWNVLYYKKECLVIPYLTLSWKWLEEEGEFLECVYNAVTCSVDRKMTC